MNKKQLGILDFISGSIDSNVYETNDNVFKERFTEVCKYYYDNLHNYKHIWKNFSSSSLNYPLNRLIKTELEKYDDNLNKANKS